jgi:hypothetical protein
MDYSKRVFKKNPDVAERKIDDEFILVPVCQSLEDVNCIYTLNEISGRIWELIDGKKSLKDIKEKLLEEYKVSPERLEEDVLGVVKEFEEIKCILAANA